MVKPQRKLGTAPEIDGAPKRNAAGPKTRRLHINLPEELFFELDRLAKGSNRTMTEIVRSSLGLVRIAVEEERRGNKMAVIDADGHVRKEIVLL